MRKTSFWLLLLMLMGVLPVAAQIRGNNIQVMVVPDHQDWNYEVGQTATFQVSVRKSSTLLNNIKVDYEAGPEMYPDVKKKDVVLKDGTLTVKGKMKTPGFYRLTVTAYADGKEYKGSATAAFSPEKLQPTTTEPADFDQFWSKTLEQARWTTLEARR